MKKYIYNFIFITLLSLIIISINDIILATPLPSSSIGEVTDYQTTELSGLKYEYFDITKPDEELAKIFHASFDPVNSDLEMILYDNFQENAFNSTMTVLEAAKQYEQQFGRKVYAAVNGDFYRTDSDGVIKPVGGYIRDGIIYKPSVFSSETYSNRLGFGFNNQGEVIVDILTDEIMQTWTYQMNIVNKGEIVKKVRFNKINQAPNDGEISIYISQNKTFTMNGQDTAKYLVKVERDKNDNPNWGMFRPVNGFAYRLVKGESITNNEVLVRDGYIGIEVNNKDEDIEWLFNNFSICNTTIELYMVPINQFENMDYYIGGCAYLVENGNITTKSCSYPPHTTGNHPRTTIGITRDNKFFVTVLDGRQPDWSQGFPTIEQAQVAHDLNAYQAIEIDGGGSSTFVLRENDELKVVNRPSNGSLRPVSNFVLIVDKKVDNNLLKTGNNLINIDSCYRVEPLEDKINSNYSPYLYLSLFSILLLTSGYIIFKIKK